MQVDTGQGKGGLTSAEGLVSPGEVWAALQDCGFLKQSCQRKPLAFCCCGWLEEEGEGLLEAVEVVVVVVVRQRWPCRLTPTPLAQGFLRGSGLQCHSSGIGILSVLGPTLAWRLGSDLTLIILERDLRGFWRLQSTIPPPTLGLCHILQEGFLGPGAMGAVVRV